MVHGSPDCCNTPSLAFLNFNTPVVHNKRNVLQQTQSLDAFHHESMVEGTDILGRLVIWQLYPHGGAYQIS
jgi:hypothetical protein